MEWCAKISVVQKMYSGWCEGEERFFIAISFYLHLDFPFFFLSLFDIYFWKNLFENYY